MDKKTKNQLKSFCIAFSMILLISIALFAIFVMSLTSKIENQKIQGNIQISNDEIYERFYLDMNHSLYFSKFLANETFLLLNRDGFVNIYDKNLTLLNQKNINDDSKYKIKLNSFEMGSDGNFWFAFGKTLFGDRSLYNSKQIVVINHKNNSDYKIINLNQTKQTEYFCFDERSAYLISYENGFKFGLAKIGFGNYSIEKEVKIKLNDSSYTMLKDVECDDDNIYVLESDRLLSVDKDGFNYSTLIMPSEKNNFDEMTYDKEEKVFYLLDFTIGNPKNVFYKYFLENNSLINFTLREDFRIVNVKYHEDSESLFLVLKNDSNKSYDVGVYDFDKSEFVSLNLSGDDFLIRGNVLYTNDGYYDILKDKTFKKEIFDHEFWTVSGLEFFG